MSNPDVPSLEACQRLAKVWPVVDRQITRRWYLLPEGEAYSGALATHLHLGYSQDSLVPARSIGEMLAEIREGRLSFSDAVAKSLLSRLRSRLDAPIVDCFANLLTLMTADDLANAMAEAMEKGGTHV